MDMNNQTANTDNTDNTADTDNADDSGRHRPSRGNPPMRRGPQRGPNNGPSQRSRARRGAVGRSILMLLADRPMHGYEIISAIEERTGGAWKPSAGSMYPALERMHDKGLIAPTADADDDKQRYQLTDMGQRRVSDMKTSGITEPWVEAAQIHGGGLRGATEELVGMARQIARFGSPAQATAAKAIVEAATVQLTQVLVDGRSPVDADADHTRT